MKKILMVLICVIGIQHARAQVWGTGGNSIATGDFLGTTNNEDLVFKTNGTEKMRLAANGELGLTLGSLNLNTFNMTNNGAYRTILNSNGAAKIDMGFTVHGYMDFILHTGSGYRHVLHMNGDGYVGIGTGNPNSVLDIFTPLSSAGSYPSQKWKTNDPLYNLNLYTELDNVNGINYNFIQKFNGTDYNSLSFYKGFTGINTATPNHQLDVNGDINMSGILRFGGQWFLSGTGAYNVFLGLNTGQAGIKNSFVGDAAGGSNKVTGVNNSFFGYNSGHLNEVGYENTFVGSESGYSNVDGYANTFVGYQSGYSTNAPTSHDPYGNSFFGHQSGFSNTTGQGNVFLGKSAGYGNQTGVFNVAIGLRAGESLTSGARNVAIGGEAGNSMLSTAADNVLIGYNSGNSTDGQRNCYIGRDVTSVGDYNVVIGGMGTSSGTGTVRGIVAIGSGSSVGRISTSSNVNGSMAIGYNAFSYGLDNSAAIGSSASVYTANTMALGGVGATIGSGGNTALTVVINKTARTTGQNYRLEIDGDAFQSTGTLWTTSDIRLKKDIKDFNNALNIIERLHPVSYKYKDDLGTAAPKEEQIGFIAQELEEVLPEMVRTHEGGSKAVNYQNLFGVLTQGIKEQQQQIVENKESVENELITVKEQNTQLVSVIDELKARLDALEQKSTGGSVTPLADSRMQQARLEQNEPNPFTDNTVIKYWVPQTAKVATIIIRSDKALEVMKFSIEHKGNGNIIVSGNTLTVGGYNCELYVDGKLADSKKMILVK